MIFKRKYLKKLFAFLLALNLLLNPIVVRLAYAEGEEGISPTPAPEVFVSPVPTEIPAVTVAVETTPTPVATLETGDAVSAIQNETTANTTEDNVPGLLTEGTEICTPPEGQTTCPNDVEINNDNTAEIDSNGTSLATTGENSITGAEGDVILDSGDGTASGTMQNTVNLNIVNLEPTVTSSGVEVTLTPAPNPENPEQSGPSEPQKSLTVENNNNAEVKVEGQVVATTGENIASDNFGNVQIATGDALAWMNVLNLINMNLVGSNFELMVLNLTSSGSEDIDLNKLWEQIQAKQANDSLFLSGDTNASNLTISVSNDNKCVLENNISVSAESGNNEANGNNSAVVNTGDAIALVNVNNFVNVNIIGSKFLFTVINLFADQNGNLILPRSESFLTQGSSSGTGGFVFENSNGAEITDSVQSLADSGNNLSEGNGGDNSVTTGNSDAIANSFTVANLNAWLNNWFYFKINNLSNWQGNVLGWTSPDAVEEAQSGTQDFQVESNQSETIVEVSVTPTPAFSFQNENDVKLTDNIQAVASTGNNQTDNNTNGSQVTTGNARSVANLFNLVNANILGGNWFFGMINVLGNWTGNVIFAYPDLTVTLEKSVSEIEVGETMSLNVSYENKGYDEAKNAYVVLDLPSGVTFLSDTSGSPLNTNGSSYSWPVGDLEPGEKGGFFVHIKINSDFNFENLQTFWSKIIKNAYAAENAKEKKISLIASIGTLDPESDFSNNSTTIDTVVYQPVAEESGEDQRQAKLEVTAVNNVNGFVYPGDTVSFTILIKNTSDVPSKNTTLTQKLYNGGPEDFGTFNFNIGTIDPGKTAKLTFGLKLPDNGTLIPDDYRTITVAFGKSPNGDAISSNEARTGFDIKAKQIAGIFEVQAIGKEEENVLGAASECPLPKKDNILPFVLLFALSSLWIVEKSRKLSKDYLKNK